jgi:hypothetical protein
MISAVQRFQFVSDKMSNIILRNHWCGNTVLNIYHPTDDKINNIKDTFYKKLDCILNKFHKYITKILLGDFKAKVGRDDILKTTIGNESSHEINKYNAVRIKQ